MRRRQRHCIWRSFTDCPSTGILYYPEERDDKGELIQTGHYELLRRATLLSQPENEKIYSLGDYVAVCSETTDWFMYVMSEKIQFFKGSNSQVYEEIWAVQSWKSGSEVSNISQMLHSIPSIDNPMH